MAKKTVNIGTSVNKGDGDPLRTAFGKINDNFDEIYGAIGSDGSIFNPLNVDSHLLPDGDNTRDLGSPDKRWRDIFVAPGSLYIGDLKLSNDNGTLLVQQVTDAGLVTETPVGGPGSVTTDRLVNGENEFVLLNNGTVELNGDPFTGGGGAFNQSLNTGDSVTFDSVGATTVNVSQINGTNPGDELVIQANNNNWTFGTDGDLTLPAGGDIVDSNGTSVIGGVSPVQPYLELTNEPFITQAAVLGAPVTVTAAPQGINALFQINIIEGPVLVSFSVTTPGTGYVPGQNYKIFYDQIGGQTDSGSLTFTIDTVDTDGGILTVIDMAFVGVPDNSPAGYGNVSITYQASVFDEIAPGLTLTRDVNQGLYNVEAETEYDNNTYLSPLGTEWNADGWGDLTGLAARRYTTWRQALNNQVGNEIVASELVMHDTINDKYYKFDFTNWGGNNGSFAYTRTLVEDPNYFKKDDYATANNVDVIEDDSSLQIGITRDENNGIYNPFTEEGWDEDVSPQGTVWNIDGWNDLTDVETRTYDNLYAAFGNGGLGNKIVGAECVMYVPSIEKYYAIKFLSWTQNNQGGGFSYTRKEIDLTQLNEGITFPDGTVLKSAQGIGRVKSTAVGDRRIEETTGYNQVTVTQIVTTNLTTVASRAETGGYYIWIDSTATTIDDIINTPANYNNAYGFEFSLDDSTWYTWTGGIGNSGDSLGYSVTQPLTYLQGDTVYFRYKTGGASVVWWDKADLPGGGGNFRGAVIDYHAYTGESTIIGTIHIVDDSGEEHISHQEVQSGSTDGENDDLWVVTNEGQIRYRRIDGESKTLKIHWTAKVFYGTEYYD
jgi:hypothetical protein